MYNEMKKQTSTAAASTFHFRINLHAMHVPISQLNSVGSVVSVPQTRNSFVVLIILAL